MSSSPGGGIRQAFRESLVEGQAHEESWVNSQKAAGLAVAHGVRGVVEGVKWHERVQIPDAVGLFRLELKTRSIAFTTPDDFPYDTVFVCNARQRHKDITDPIAYIIQSKPTGCWAWILSTDESDDWVTRFVTDTRGRERVLTLECPRSYLRPAHTLQKFLLKHEQLEFVDGDTSVFGEGK